MIIEETPLKGAYLVRPERFEDERGFFARTWSQSEFAEAGINCNFVESNVSFNRKRGTLRGMHYQVQPHAQAKLVRCTRGAIFDVALDLRPESSTFKQWFGVELTTENLLMYFIPEGFAHGFQTLVNETEVLYQMSSYFVPESARGVRWDDPAFGIKWPPQDVRTIISRDREYPDFKE